MYVEYIPNLLFEFVDKFLDDIFRKNNISIYISEAV